MTEYILRPARETDSKQIKGLIHLVGINPTGLDWKRFIVAVDVRDQVIGCGQLKPHGGDILELASIAVQPEYQKQGIGRAVIEHLLKDSPRPLFLMCIASTGPLYEKFGFRAIDYGSMPHYFQRMTKLAGLAEYLMQSDEYLLVMKLG
jgi:N-acetylglutamate synthase-like GNAT family acetyltransferase